MPSTTYYWDEDDDNVCCEEDANGEITASYTHEPGLYGEVIAVKRGDDVRYFNFDGEGNTSELTDDEQNVTDTFEYSAFGEEVARTGTTLNPFGYKGALGYYTNETGDIYVRARKYVPTIGRWLSLDPLRRRSKNRYTYVSSSPTVRVDPSGLIEIKDPFEIIDEIITEIIYSPEILDDLIERLEEDIKGGHRLACVQLKNKIASYLQTDPGRRAWQRFTSGSGLDYELSRDEMDDIVSRSTNLQNWLRYLKFLCYGNNRFIYKKVVGDSLPKPWNDSIGGVSINLTFECKDSPGCEPCFSWEAEINDRYDFDPKWIGSHRTPEGEYNTRLVWLVQILSRCGWKEFFHTGKTGDTNCSPDHDEKGREAPKVEPAN